MRSWIGSVAVVVGLLGSAAAQPGATQPAPPAGYGAPPPQPGYGPPPAGHAPPPAGYAPPPYVYPPQVQLTLEDHLLLRRGEISDAAHLGGGLATFFFGFGVGHAIQGRWSERGWLFTLGEGATLAAMLWGVARTVEDCLGYDDATCDEDRGVGLIVAGALGFTVFRIWGTVDAFAGPSDHNRRVRELRLRLGYGPQPGYYSRVVPYVVPARDGGGAVGGLTLRF